MDVTQAKAALAQTADDVGLGPLAATRIAAMLDVELLKNGNDVDAAFPLLDAGLRELAKAMGR